MKRSRINRALREMEIMLTAYRVALPPFCHFTPEEWADKGHAYDEIRHNMLGWDITDYGLGDFDRIMNSAEVQAMMQWVRTPASFCRLLRSSPTSAPSPADSSRRMRNSRLSDHIKILSGRKPVSPDSISIPPPGTIFNTLFYHAFIGLQEPKVLFVSHPAAAGRAVSERVSILSPLIPAYA